MFHYIKRGVLARVSHIHPLPPRAVLVWGHHALSLFALTWTVNFFKNKLPTQKMLFRNCKLESVEWSAMEDSLLFRSFHPDLTPPDRGGFDNNTYPKLKIAGFDFDDTLVKKHNNELAFSSVLDKLKHLHDDDYTLVMFSNEALDHLKKTESIARTLMKKLNRLDTFVERLGLPFRIYVATRKDKYRKPSTKDTAKAGVTLGGKAMWTKMEQDLGEEIDMVASFYCGDAAGRRGEFSDADLAFANAVGVRFEHASDFFKLAPSVKRAKLLGEEEENRN